MKRIPKLSQLELVIDPDSKDYLKSKCYIAYAKIGKRNITVGVRIALIDRANEFAMQWKNAINQGKLTISNTSNTGYLSTEGTNDKKMGVTPSIKLKTPTTLSLNVGMAIKMPIDDGDIQEGEFRALGRAKEKYVNTSKSIYHITKSDGTFRDSILKLNVLQALVQAAFEQAIRNHRLFKETK